MKTPNTWWNRIESEWILSVKHLLPTLVAALVFTLSCSKDVDTTKPYIERDRDSTKTLYVNPSGIPWQWRYRWWKAYAINEPDWTRTFKLTENRAWYMSLTDWTYFAPETWELKFGNNWDTTAVHIKDPEDLIPDVDYYITQSTAQQLTWLQKIFFKLFHNKKILTDDIIQTFQEEFWDLDNPK